MALKVSEIDEIFSSCAESEKNYITAQTIYYYCTSPYMVYCEKFAPEDKKDPLTAYQALIFEQNKIHRQHILKEKFPNPDVREYKSRKSGFKILLEGMKEGADILCDLPAYYMPETLKAVFDILERRDTAPSLFGQYHYVGKKIVSAKTIKDHHIAQGSFLNYLLGKIQGYTPEIFYLINRDGEEIPKKYEEEKIKEIIRDIQDIFNGVKKVTPTYDQCEWPWRRYTNEKAVEMNDVSLVTGIGQSTKGKFYKEGIKTVEDLMKTDKKKLKDILEEKKEEKKKKKVIKIKTKKRKKEEIISDKAKSLFSDKLICLEPCEFPDTKTEIFLDFEYIEDQLYFNTVVDIDYLIGVVTRKSGKVEYKPFFAHQLDKGGEIFYQFIEFIEFIEWLSEHEGFVIYHFYYPEKTHLKKLAERCGLSKEVLGSITEAMIDIHEVFTNTFVIPTYKNGLKDIAQYIGYSWKHPDVDGNECTALYLEYVENPEKNKDSLQKILDYNEDDCKALMKVKDWMQKKAKVSIGEGQKT